VAVERVVDASGDDGEKALSWVMVLVPMMARSVLVAVKRFMVLKGSLV